MADDIGVNVGGADELGRLAERLKGQAGGAAQRRYARAVQSTAGPVEQQLVVAVLGVRVTSAHAGGSVTRARKPHNLRRRTAAAVGHKDTKSGLRFLVHADQVDPEYGSSLPRYLDGELAGWRRWRHPVFGRRDDTWAQQTGSPWFFATIRKAAGRIESAVLRAMDDVADDITGA